MARLPIPDGLGPTPPSSATTSALDDLAAGLDGNHEQLTLSYETAGYVPWTDYILGDARDDDDRKAHISDHYPLWVEFGLG
jgi:hypothetical protein